MKEWELSMEELDASIGDRWYSIDHFVLERLGKAYQKKLAEYLKEKGGHFMTEVEGHKGYYELDWVIFEELCGYLGVKNPSGVK